jgi:hypothetical protein
MLDDHKTPRHIRVIELLRLLHGLNMPHVLAFWMLLHVISDPKLLERVRAETSQVVKVVQDAAVLGFTVPPRVTVDTDGLLKDKTPLLKHCWLETARLYSRGQGSSTVAEDFDLNGEEEGIFKATDKWKMNKGDWIDTPYWLANGDPATWEDPEKWDPERHLQEGSNASVLDTCEHLSLYPSLPLALTTMPIVGLFGMEEATTPARLFTLAFVASALALYDFEADAEKGIPKPQFAAGVALPAGDVRVRIRKRTLA